MSRDGSIRWPAVRFYWAVVDASLLEGAGRVTAERLGYLFESFLPVPIDEVHAVYAPLDGRRYIACGVERAILDQEIQPHWLTLTPESLPDFIDEPIDPDRLNLLIGPYEPVPVRLARRAWLAQAAVLALAVVLVATLGMERRRRVWLDHQSEANMAIAELYERTLGPSGGSTQPPELRLLAQLRQLRRTRANPAAANAFDADLVLASLLSNWPSDLPLRTESLTVAKPAVTIVGLVPDAAASQRVADELTAPFDYRARQPQVQALRDGVRLTLRYESTEATP